MRQFLLLLALAIPLAGHAQNTHENLVERVQPAPTSKGFFLPKFRGLASETKATARDCVSFRDPKWEALTWAQIAAATADAHTSLQSLHRCSYCQEVGSSKFVIGMHPDAHKYLLAGLVEVSVEAVASHYLRHHGPIHKWYWRAVWALPQSASVLEHTRASVHNVGTP
jgi:hypothetical protein